TATGAAGVFAAGKLGKSVLEPIGPGAVPMVASLVLIGLSLIVLWRAFKTGAPRTKSEEFTPRPAIALFGGTLTCAYFLVMELEWLSFRWATVGYVAILTAALLHWRPRMMPVAVALGLIMGVGLQYVFTQVLYVDLPS